MKLKAPFIYFGGKARVADEVWRRFGNPKTYVEPFSGSCAVLLARPGGAFGREIVNDYDGNIANFWRALQADPEGIIKWCDWPCNHIDLHARRAYLIDGYSAMRGKLLSDPDWFDAKIAGYWVWCTNNWIGSGMMKPRKNDTGICKQPQLTVRNGTMGLRDKGSLRSALSAISERIKSVKVVCGDWSQVLGGNWRTSNGECAVFLDPPYSDSAGREPNLYDHDSLSVANDVRRWCVEHGDDPLYRIALCGYEGEHDDLEMLDWEVWSWSANGGYGNQGDGTGRENRKKERIWFSPHCLQVDEGTENDRMKGAADV